MMLRSISASLSLSDKPSGGKYVGLLFFEFH